MTRLERIDAAAAQPLAQTLFSVPGMRCAGCIGKLERGLAAVDGIHAARVNFTAKRVAVSHDPDLLLPDLASAFDRLGFAAQPVQAAFANTAFAQEARDLLKALAVAGFATMNIMLLSVSVWSGASGATRDMFHWLSALIALPTLVYAGRPFFKSAFAALRHGRTNMDVPVSIGVVLASALSLYETITGGPHAYFDGVVMLLFFLLTGRWLDAAMRERARDGVTALLKHMAPGALAVAGDGATRWIAAADIRPGMDLLIAAGERLAADGIIADGSSRFDLSLLTGEAAPVRRAAGDAIHAGTLNLDAPVTMRVTAAAQETAIADIARLMEEAGQGKSRYVRIADRAARLYAPAVHTLALASFAGWMIAGAGWHQSLLIAVAVLIITCPCALGLAVPAAQITAAGALMKRGLLVKDGSALERMAEVTGALFDKTGTLTLGQPQPEGLDDLTADQRSVALALARSSRHPLSEALRRSLEADGVQPAPLADLSETPGEGLRASWKGRPVSLLRPTEGLGDHALASALAIGDGAPTIIRFRDRLRADATATLARLKAMGIGSTIISGDRAEAVSTVARAVGATGIAAMLPADKLEVIARRSATGEKLLMVGDGLNDGPALAAGHASIAPASASDAGQQAADMVFLGESLAPVASAITMARATQAIVRQNFALAIGYNALAVPLAIAGLVTPLVAALAMSGSSLVVIANALRLKAVKL